MCFLDDWHLGTSEQKETGEDSVEGSSPKPPDEEPHLMAHAAAG